MKIVVYAICKNEEKFIKRWVNSMKEADDIYVLDTGSTDNSIELLKKYGVKVSSKKITPWRFDTARNLSLEIIPDIYDIYVCTDLDEVFVPGWRKNLEKNWKKNTTRCHYVYNWKLDDLNNPLVSFYSDKIHIKGYKWTHPVHEVLEYKKKENIITMDDVVLNHYPDISKSRSSYLPLLELSVKENPLDDRNMHYLGREYMYHQKWEKCIDTLIKHLNLPTSLWKDERCASMRFIARSYQNLNKYDDALKWLNKAIKEAPYLREPWVEMGLLLYQNNQYEKTIFYLENALKIKVHQKNYINEPFCWDETPYDILSICYFEIKNYDKALENIVAALVINQNDERLIQNKRIIEDAL